MVFYIIHIHKSQKANSAFQEKDWKQKTMDLYNLFFIYTSKTFINLKKLQGEKGKERESAPRSCSWVSHADGKSPSTWATLIFPGHQKEGNWIGSGAIRTQTGFIHPATMLAQEHLKVSLILHVFWTQVVLINSYMNRGRVFIPLKYELYKNLIKWKVKMLLYS